MMKKMTTAYSDKTVVFPYDAGRAAVTKAHRISKKNAHKSS